MKNTGALLIFAKAPGKDVKTRLAGSLSDQERIALYERLLVDTIRKLRKMRGIDTFIFYSPRDRKEYFRKFRLALYPQAEGDLGARMASAFDTILKKGYREAVMVGADIPGLTSGTISRAFRLLERHDVVFGPATDGGYYLIGLKQPDRDLFRGIEWSTAHTLQQSIRRAEQENMLIGYTEYLSDVDTMRDAEETGVLNGQ